MATQQEKKLTPDDEQKLKTLDARQMEILEAAYKSLNPDSALPEVTRIIAEWYEILGHKLDRKSGENFPSLAYFHIQKYGALRLGNLNGYKPHCRYRIARLLQTCNLEQLIQVTLDLPYLLRRVQMTVIKGGRADDPGPGTLKKVTL